MSMEFIDLCELGGFLLGLLFGSFLNVCISRLPAHESILKPRSHCPACGRPIRWYDNIPLLSWLILRARCRDCNAPISWRYPLVELAVGLWLLIMGSRFGALITHTWNIDQPLYIWWISHTINLIGLTILGFLLIGLLVMDWRTHRLPDAFTLTGIGIGVLLACMQAIFLAPGEGDIVLNSTRQLRLSSPGSFAAQGNVFLTGPEALVFGRIAAVCGAALILLAVRWLYKRLRGREGMGLGDVKLLALIAAFLGFTQSLLALFAGVLAAALYGLTLLLRRRATTTTRIPFGSFLAAGGLFAALFGNSLLGWYTSLFR
jgi:leader peptidase (prepilin peptidase)/N-methyltransferase